MVAPKESWVQVDGTAVRVWEAGNGAPLTYLAGLGGLPRWTPFLDMLARQRRVVVPSLPGFPGGGTLHEQLDTQLDWISTVGTLLERTGAMNADLMGVSFGGSLAAEVAAMWPERIEKLILLAPMGLYDTQNPSLDVFALRPGQFEATVAASTERIAALRQPGPQDDALEWHVTLVRANAAAARMLWPLGDTGLAKRLGRIRARTLLLWGAMDRVLPPSYAERFATQINASCEQQTLAGAGHLADIDAPESAAQAVLAFLEGAVGQAAS